MYWLPFYWDPTDLEPEGQGLKMVTDEAEGDGEGEGKGDSGWYILGPEVHAPPGIDAGHVDAEGVIRTDRARSLDCFTVVPPRVADEAPVLAYQEDLDFLEEFIGVVARHAYVGSIARASREKL